MGGENMKKKTILIISILFLVIVISTGIVFAANMSAKCNGNDSTNVNCTNMNCSNMNDSSCDKSQMKCGTCMMTCRGMQ